MISRSRKPLLILLSAGIFGMFFLLLTLPLEPSGTVLTGHWQVVDTAGAVSVVELPYLQPLEQGQEIVLQTLFPAVPGDMLVIRRPSGNALRITLNDDLIYTLGNFTEPTANIWNSILAVPLPHELAAENLLQIQISGVSYDLGMTLTPYIDVSAKVLPRVMLANALYNNLLYISIGAVIIVGLILIVLSFARSPRYGTEFFLGLACISSAFFCLDYIFRISSGDLATFLLLKKLIMISGYLGAFSFLIGLEKLSGSKFWFGWFALFPTLVSIVIIGTAPDMIAMNRALSYLNPVLLFNIAAVIVIILHKLRSQTGLIIPAVLLALSLVQLIALTVMELSLPFVLQYVMLVSALVFGVNMILTYNNLYRENLALERKANRDPLTGAFNRNILSRIHPKLHDILILLDLDNLKHYNDRYGHVQGDRLLTILTKTIRTNLRQNDLVIRYGGDEFVLILNAASVDDSEHIMQRISSQFLESFTDVWVGFSYGIAEIDVSLTRSLTIADRHMYTMKRRKKRPPEMESKTSSSLALNTQAQNE